MAISRPPGQVEESGGDGTLSKDLVFTMLSNGRRRHVIHYLKQRGERVTLRELSRQVAAWENGVETDDLDYKQRKRVYTSLHQTHLPKLNDAGIVDYDRDRGTVALDEAARELEVYMEIVPEKELPWSVYYLGLSGIAASLVFASGIGAWPFVLLPDVAWGIAITAMFTVSSIAHTYYARGQRIGEHEKPPELRRE